MSEKIATREAYGKALVELGAVNEKVVVLDADLAGATVELIGTELRERQLDKALSSVKKNYDLIFIDCPPSLELLTLNALCASDGILIPVQCEYYALEGLSQLMKTVRQIKSSYNPQIEIEGVLLTMYERRYNVTRAVDDDVRAAFGDKVFKTVVPRNVRVSEAPSHGMPALFYDFNSSGAQAYLRVATEVVQRTEGGCDGK